MLLFSQGSTQKTPKLGKPTFYFAILPFPVPHSQYPGYDPYNKFYPPQKETLACH